MGGRPGWCQAPRGRRSWPTGPQRMPSAPPGLNSELQQQPHPDPVIPAPPSTHLWCAIPPSTAPCPAVASCNDCESEIPGTTPAPAQPAPTQDSSDGPHSCGSPNPPRPSNRRRLCHQLGERCCNLGRLAGSPRCTRRGAQTRPRTPYEQQIRRTSYEVIPAARHFQRTRSRDPRRANCPTPGPPQGGPGQRRAASGTPGDTGHGHASSHCTWTQKRPGPSGCSE
mmetsp:Transcript_9106/g.19618  ORF Transcript_9106/g.19618 Transcript_9106/m.19618 type:complete len:225 (-) Transcript_9106:1448-2122(-)